MKSGFGFYEFVDPEFVEIDKRVMLMDVVSRTMKANECVVLFFTVNFNHCRMKESSRVQVLDSSLVHQKVTMRTKESALQI